VQDVLGASLERIFARIIEFIPSLIVAVILFVLTLYLARLSFNAVEKTLTRRKVDPELKLLMARLAQWSVIILGTIWALAQVNFDVTGFVAGLGIIGFTVGFA
jgi:small conductance mechanosensitive channel